jgi:uncharacterized protein
MAMTTWQRIARWTDWDGNGLEHLSVRQDDAGILAESVVIGHSHDHRYGLSYRLQIDPGWRVREVDIHMVDGPKLQLLSDGLGCWRNADGAEIAPLAGCLDVDIAATPFTNTLPIRRLALSIGATETIHIAYVSLPDLAVETVQQRYTRLAERRFLYEGLSTSFAAELDVDEHGIVGDYPGVFRLAP